MAGGQTIVYGLLSLLIFLLLITRYDQLGAVCQVVVGAVPLVLIITGSVMVLIGYTDWRNQKANAASEGAGDNES